jgi:glutathione S-transferase
MADVTVTKPTLTYFNAPGRSELARVILEVAGVDYDFVAVANWPEAKAAYAAAGKVPFGQLPIYEEPDGLVMSQSMAIARYLARRHGLVGASEHEAALVEMAAEGVNDIYEQLITVFFKTPAEQRPPVLDKFLAEFLPVHLGHISALLERNGDNGRLVGAKLSYADLFLWVALEAIFPRVPGSKELVEGKYPKVKAFLDGVASHERIKAYQARNVYATPSSQ